MREFLPARLGDLDWSSRERNLSGHLVESLASGFAIHLRISLSEVKGDAFMGTLGVDRMEDHPVVKMVGDKVVDTVRGTAWYSLVTRGLVMGGGVGGGVGRMVHCNSYSDN